MAKCVARKICEYQLTLTENEVNSLECLLRRVGGSPEYSIRGYLDNIKNAIHTVISDNRFSSHIIFGDNVNKNSIYCNQWLPNPP